MKLKNLTLPATGFVFAMSTAMLPVSVLAAEEHVEKKREAQSTINEAAEVIRQMKSDPEVIKHLQTVEGVFIVPDYGRAALGVGGYGGQGVLLTRQGDEWSDPVFYNFGGITAGAEAGVEAGEIAMLLTNEKAVNSFMSENNFSLNADAGVTLVDFSERAQAAAGKGDVIIWSDTEGAYADLAISAENISWDEEETRAYYGEYVSNPSAVTSGKVNGKQDNVLAGMLR